MDYLIRLIDVERPISTLESAFSPARDPGMHEMEKLSKALECLSLYSLTVCAM